MKRYQVKLTGVSPLLMHHDNLEWERFMTQWKLDPANKKVSVAGDDRSPAFRWIGYLYTEAGRVVIPADNLMTVLREGGTKVSTGQGQKTFKAQTQSGIIVDQAAWSLCNNGKEVPYAPIKKLIDETDFEAHQRAIEGMGFELFVKRAKIGAAKHVRVRPRFDSWSTSGTLTVFDETITSQILQIILNMAGAYCGICDWRPSSPKAPGPFGKFSAEVQEVR
jgi:hypothetical protein